MDMPLSTDAPATIGHNRPPVEVEIRDRHRDLFARIDDLIGSAERVPPVIADEEVAGKAQDLIRMARIAEKQAEATMKAEYEPFEAVVKTIRAIFKKPVDGLRKAIEPVKSRHEDYLQAKRRAEEARLAEEARRKREEADRALREAAEAEARRRRAEEERAAAERAAAEAQARREAEEAKARAAREAARIAEEERRRIETERRERQRLEAERQERDAAAETARKERQRFEEEALAAAKAAREKAEAEVETAREAARKATEERRAAEEQARQAKAGAHEAGREEKVRLGDAAAAEQRAGRYERQATGSPADKSRIRSDYGTVGSLARRWTFTVHTPALVPLDRLRGYLAADAIEAAITKFQRDNIEQIKANPRLLPGVLFEEVEVARVV
jgi:chromosome segregation ATPase